MADLRNNFSEQQPISESCGTYSSLMTALFDGEADAESARLARTHLEDCARCADMWQTWQRHRFVLQTSPTPLPPFNLLARILLACRLVALSGRNGRRHAELRGPEFDHKSLTVSKVFSISTANLRSLTDEPLPPADLRETILRLTTRQSGLAGQIAVRISDEPYRPAFWGLGGRFAALAVPAVLLWVVLSSPRPAFVEIVTDNSTSKTQVPSHAPSRPALAVAVKQQGAPHSLRRSNVLKTAMAMSEAAAKPPASVKVNGVSINKDSAKVRSTINEEMPALQVHRKNLKTIHSYPVASNHNSTWIRNVEVTMVSWQAPRIVTNEDGTQLEAPSKVRYATSRATPTPPRIAAIRLARYARPSSPIKAGEHNTTFSDDSMPEDIEVLEEGHGVEEERSDAVRQVVEDYQACLISDIAENGEEETSNEADNG